MSYDRLRRFLSDEKTAGRYELGEVLGEGGMGVVFDAWDPQLERRVAVKLFKTGDPEKVRREAAAAAKLHHPNIVAIHEIGPDYIVMDAIDGPTLAAAWPALGIPERLAIIAKVARAVGHAHAAGIVHRDLKPGNVLLKDGHEPVLTDFGLARAMSEDLSHSRAAAGTAPYMAPEQVQGKDATPASDVWSLGVMLHEAIAGRRPFEGQSLYDVQDAIVRATPARLDHPAASLVLRALNKDPGKRFPDAVALADALAEPPRKPPGRTGWRAASAVAIVSIAIAGWFGWTNWRLRHLREPWPPVGTPVMTAEDAVQVPAGLTAADRLRWFAGLEQTATNALAADPRDRSALARRGAIRRTRADDAREHGRNPFPDWDAAAADYSRILERDPLDTQAQLARGVVRAQSCAYKRMYALDPASDCAAAETDLTPLTERFPRAFTWRGNARFNLGLFLAERAQPGKQPEAQRLFIEAEADLSHVRDADTLARRGRVRAYLRRLPDAETDFRDAVALGADSPWLWTWWGAALRRSGDLDGALDKLTRAITADPEFAEAWAERGHAHLEKHDLAAALSDYQAAIASNPVWEPLLADRVQQARQQVR